MYAVKVTYSQLDVNRLTFLKSDPKIKCRTRFRFIAKAYSVLVSIPDFTSPVPYFASAEVVEI